MSKKLPRVPCRQVLRALERAGFEVVRQRGSHVHLRRESNHKRVTVPCHAGHDIPTGTLRAILRDVGISIDEFVDLLQA